MIRLINSKDFSNFFTFMSGDSSLTTQDIKKMFNKCIKHGDKAFMYEEVSKIQGILLIRKDDIKKSLSIFADNTIANHLIKYMTWNVYEPLTVTTKKYSPLVKLFNKFSYNKFKADKFNLSGFQFVGVKEKDITFNFIPSKKENYNRFIKEEDKNDN